MSKKKKIRFFIALVACFVLGAGTVLLGIHMEWETWIIAVVLIGVGVVVTPATFAIISGIKDDEDED